MSDETDHAAWLATLTPAQRERLDRCWCGSVAAILQGRRSWMRSDILCPECDGTDTTEEH